MTGNDDRPLLEPTNPCDTTIGNEFPESDASLEITSLKCCILTQNKKGCIIRVPTVLSTKMQTRNVFHFVSSPRPTLFKTEKSGTVKLLRIGVIMIKLVIQLRLRGWGIYG